MSLPISQAATGRNPTGTEAEHLNRGSAERIRSSHDAKPTQGIRSGLRSKVPLSKYTTITAPSSSVVLLTPPSAGSVYSELFQKLPEMPEMPESIDKNLPSKLNKLAKQFSQGNYKKVLNIYNLILTTQLNPDKDSTLDAEQKTKLREYINRMMFLCQINEEGLDSKTLESLLSKLPRKDYLEWHHAIARSFYEKSPCIGENSKVNMALALQCYRIAADCGDNYARLALVNQLLFSSISLVPDEAVIVLEELAASNIEISATNEHEKALLDMIKLIRKEDNKADLRKTIISKWLDSEHHNIVQLVPMLYLYPAFGEFDFKEICKLMQNAKLKIEPNSEDSNTEKGMVYWVFSGSSLLQEEKDVKPTLRTLHKFADNGSLFALNILAKYYLNKSKINEGLELLLKNDARLMPRCELYPDLALVFSRLLRAQKKEDAKQYGDMDVRHKELLKRLNCILEFNRNKFYWTESAQASINQKKCSSYLALKSDKHNDGNIDWFNEALQKRLYSEDPQWKVFKHLADFVETGKADDELIKNAIKSDGIAALYRMAILKHCYAPYHSCEKILSDLVKLVDGDINRLMRFRNDPDFKKLALFLVTSSYLLDDTKGALLLAEKIYGITGASNQEYLELYYILTQEYHYLGESEPSRLYLNKYEEYQKSIDTTKKVVKTKLVYISFPEGSDKKDAYFDIEKFNPDSHHPLDVQCKYNTLIDLWTKIKSEENPAIAYCWVEKCCYFIKHSSSLLKQEQVEKLVGMARESIRKTYTLSIELNSNLKEQLEWLTKTESYEPKCSDADINVSDGFWDFGERVMDCAKAQSSLSRTRSILLERSPILRSVNEAALENAEDDEEFNALYRLLSDSDPFAAALKAIPIIEHFGRNETNRKRAIELARKFKALLPETDEPFNALSHNINMLLFASMSSYFKQGEDYETIPLSIEYSALFTELATSDISSFLKGCEKYRIIFTDKEFTLSQKLYQLPLAEKPEFMESIPSKHSELITLHLKKSKETPLSEDDEATLQSITNNRTFSLQRRIYAAYLLLSAGKRTDVFNELIKPGGDENKKLELLCIGCEMEIIDKNFFDKNFFDKQMSNMTSPQFKAAIKQIFNVQSGNFEKKELSSVMTSYSGMHAFIVNRCLTILSREEVLDFLKKFKLTQEALNYQLAILASVHKAGLLPVKETLKKIIAAASAMNSRAQCLYLDYILNCIYSHATHLSRCFRYLATPSVDPTPERTLYLGISIYKGLGCQKDEAQGKKLIEQALASDSPLPALLIRMSMESDHLPDTLFSPQNLMEVFVKNCQLLSDQKKAALAAELVLDLGVNTLRRYVIPWLESLKAFNKELTEGIQDNINALNKEINRWEGSKAESVSKPDKATVKNKKEQAKLENLAKQEALRKEKKLKNFISQWCTSDPVPENTDELFDHLNKLKSIQASQFPNFNHDHDALCMKLLENIPLDTSDWVAWAIEIFNSISTWEEKKSASKQLLEKLNIEKYLTDMALINEIEPSNPKPEMEPGNPKPEMEPDSPESKPKIELLSKYRETLEIRKEKAKKFKEDNPKKFEALVKAANELQTQDIHKRQTQDIDKKNTLIEGFMALLQSFE